MAFYVGSTRVCPTRTINKGTDKLYGWTYATSGWGTIYTKSDNVNVGDTAYIFGDNGIYAYRTVGAVTNDSIYITTDPTGAYTRNTSKDVEL